MRSRILKMVGIVEWVSSATAAIAIVLMAAMIACMLYEIVARYFFNAPTIWSNDISYMLNGAVFMLGAAYTLRTDGHVRIDFLLQAMPMRLRHALQAAFYLFAFGPVTGYALHFGYERTLRAYLRGSLETASAWEPLIWPFLAGLTVGLAGLLLQVLLEAVKHLVLLTAACEGGDQTMTRGGGHG